MANKKSALRKLKRCVGGVNEIIYIWEGLTGHSRPSADQYGSLPNNKLPISGINIIIQNQLDSNQQK